MVFMEVDLLRGWGFSGRTDVRPYVYVRPYGYLGGVILFRRQRSLQYLTSSQLRSHFFRQEKLKPQTGQVLVGRCAFDMKKEHFESTIVS